MYTFLRNGATYLQSAFITYFIAGSMAWGIAIYYTIGSLIGSQRVGHDRIIDSIGHQSRVSLNAKANSI
ncbi:hypothetical protein Q8G35_16685 [Peribacillus simplex]|nr:hypothetical protein [Peribacillus simplex]MDP1419980.1 hypothetical protein [Peribacillus simplex]